MTRQDDFRGPLPLGDDDFAEVHARVMAKLARREPRPVALAFRFAFAAAAIAVVAFLLIPRSTAPKKTPVAEARRPSVVASAAPRAVPAIVPQPRPAKLLPSPKTPRPQTVAAIGAPPPDMRIEIQTGDPDVRIIWIASR